MRRSFDFHQDRSIVASSLALLKFLKNLGSRPEYRSRVAAPGILALLVCSACCILGCSATRRGAKPQLLLSDKFDVSRLLYPVDKDSVNDLLRAAGFHTEFGSLIARGPKERPLEFEAINVPRSSMLGFEGTFSAAYVSHWVQFYYFIAGRLSESDKDSLLTRVHRMYDGYGRAEGREGDNSEIYGHIRIDSCDAGISCVRDTLWLSIYFPNIQERIR